MKPKVPHLVLPVIYTKIYMLLLIQLLKTGSWLSLEIILIYIYLEDCRGEKLYR